MYSILEQLYLIIIQVATKLIKIKLTHSSFPYLSFPRIETWIIFDMLAAVAPMHRP